MGVHFAPMLRELVERGKALGFGTRHIPLEWSGLRNDWTNYVGHPHEVEQWLGPPEGVATMVSVHSAHGPTLIAAGICPPPRPPSILCAAAPALARGRGVDGGAAALGSCQEAGAAAYDSRRAASGVLGRHTEVRPPRSTLGGTT